MNLLAIDTSAKLCSVGFYKCDTQDLVAEEILDIGRGHAEVLMQQIEKCLATAKSDYASIDKLAVSIGPGSFTGVRVGMAAARGLALSLDIPLIGVSTLQACEQAALNEGTAGELVVAIDAKREQVYLAGNGHQPLLTGYDQVETYLKGFQGTLCGSGAQKVSDTMGVGLEIVCEYEAFPIVTYAERAADRDAQSAPPEPLYLREADAKVQSGFALPRAEV